MYGKFKICIPVLLNGIERKIHHRIMQRRCMIYRLLYKNLIELVHDSCVVHVAGTCHQFRIHGDKCFNIDFSHIPTFYDITMGNECHIDCEISNRMKTQTNAPKKEAD
jgi:hypothetical protein